jgi:hypothetical protein
MMTDDNRRRPRRPRLHLPLFLTAAAAEAPLALRRPAAPFPLSPEQLRTAVAEMIG